MLNSILEDSTATHLFLLGDIFDLWVADHHYFTQRFHQTLALIDALVRRGVEVHYFEGNHDLDLRPYFETRGAKVWEQAAHFDLSGRHVRMEHGDQMDPEDTGYLFLRWLLRTHFMRWLGRHLPGAGVQLLGTSMSSTSRKYTDRLKHKLGAEHGHRREKILNKVRDHVRRVRQQEPSFDLFVSGHVHEILNEKMMIDDQIVEVINLGSWLGLERPYMVLESADSKNFAMASFRFVEV